MHVAVDPLFVHLSCVWPCRTLCTALQFSLMAPHRGSMILWGCVWGWVCVWGCGGVRVCVCAARCEFERATPRLDDTLGVCVGVRVCVCVCVCACVCVSVIE